MSAPPGLSLKTSRALDACVIVLTQNLKCGIDFPLLHLGYCMTYNSTTGITEYGPCPYIAHYNITPFFDQVFYIHLPSNVSLLNEFMCGPLNQEGELCGKMAMALLYTHTLWNAVKCW